MSQENVETCLRSANAFNRRDVESYLDEFDPEVELHLSLFAMLGGSSTVFRGHEGVREYMRDLDETFAELAHQRRSRAGAHSERQTNPLQIPK